MIARWIFFGHRQTGLSLTCAVRDRVGRAEQAKPAGETASDVDAAAASLAAKSEDAHPAKRMKDTWAADLVVAFSITAATTSLYVIVRWILGLLSSALAAAGLSVRDRGMEDSG